MSLNLELIEIVKNFHKPDWSGAPKTIEQKQRDGAKTVFLLTEELDSTVKLKFKIKEWNMGLKRRVFF